MNEVKDYTIIADDRASDLIKAVNHCIRDGWTPIGGVAMSLDAYGNFRLSQAMVKTELPKESAGGEK